MVAGRLAALVLACQNGKRTDSFLSFQSKTVACDMDGMAWRKGVELYIEALERYFEDAGTWKGDWLLVPKGTEFQLKVWAYLREIPMGEVQTYGQIARKIGSSPRAVGQACRRNPIPIFIPCHRVVSQNGMGGFLGKDQSHEGSECKRSGHYEAAEYEATEYEATEYEATEYEGEVRCDGPSTSVHSHPLKIKKWLLDHERG
jgi:O-6-methylguanine DNA methyltransferase